MKNMEKSLYCCSSPTCCIISSDDSFTPLCFITSSTEGGWRFVFTSGLLVSEQDISQKVMDGFDRNLLDRLDV